MDAVSSTLPTHLRAEYTIAALKAGRLARLSTNRYV
jgi:predicted dehydrogenase